MGKFVFCCVLLVVLLISIEARGGQGQRGGRGQNGGRRSGGDKGSGYRRQNGTNGQGNWGSQLCANQTVAQAFLTQTQQLITNLQANGSFTAVLQQRTNQFNYLFNNSNGALLSSNCTAFFSGLKNARNLDRQAQSVQWGLQRTVARLFGNIVRSLVGNGPSRSY